MATARTPPLSQLTAGGVDKFPRNVPDGRKGVDVPDPGALSFGKPPSIMRSMTDPTLSTAPRTRLYVEDPLAEGVALGLDAQRAHYLRHVLRLEHGDAVALFNGRDGEYAARIDGFGKGWCSLTVGHRRRAQQAGPDVWLLFAPVKRTRIDFIAEKASELGAAVVWPVLTRRTDVARVNVERLRANAIEAAEQCERLDVPELREPRPLDRILGSWPAGRPLLVCAESGPARPLAAALAD